MCYDCEWCIRTVRGVLRLDCEGCARGVRGVLGL